MPGNPRNVDQRHWNQPNSRVNQNQSSAAGGGSSRGGWTKRGRGRSHPFRRHPSNSLEQRLGYTSRRYDNGPAAEMEGYNPGVLSDKLSSWNSGEFENLDESSHDDVEEYIGVHERVGNAASKHARTGRKSAGTV